MDNALSLKDLQQELEKLQDWALNTLPQTSITRTYKLETFDQVIDFVNKLLFLMKEQEQQPRITIDDKRVSVTLANTTINGVTIKNIKQARMIDQEYQKYRQEA